MNAKNCENIKYTNGTENEKKNREWDEKNTRNEEIFVGTSRLMCVE